MLTACRVGTITRPCDVTLRDQNTMWDIFRALSWRGLPMTSHVILCPLVLHVVTDHRKKPTLARFSLLFLTVIRIFLQSQNAKTTKNNDFKIYSSYMYYICTIKVKCMGLPLKTYPVEQSVE